MQISWLFFLFALKKCQKMDIFSWVWVFFLSLHFLEFWCPWVFSGAHKKACTRQEVDNWNTFMKLGLRTYLTFFLDKRASLVCRKCRPCLELHKDWRLTSPSCSFCSEGCRPSCIYKEKKSNQNHWHQIQYFNTDICFIVSPDHTR